MKLKTLTTRAIAAVALTSLVALHLSDVPGAEAKRPAPGAVAKIVKAAEAKRLAPRAVTNVNVKLTFYDAAGKKERPIADVPVEVWAFAPRGLGIWTWAKEAVGRSGPFGGYTTSRPFRNRHVTYAIRVLPSNGYAHCCPGWAPIGLAGGPGVYFVEPGTDRWPFKPIHRRASGPGGTVFFHHQFSGTWGSIFNVLDAWRRAGSLARSYEPRGPLGDDDRVGSLGLGLAGSGKDDTSWFNPVTGTVNLTPRHRWRDGTVLHEYGHYLQWQISRFAWIASDHRGCTPATMVVIGDGGAQTPDHLRAQHAWLEGFPDWFGEFVYWRDPALFDSPHSPPYYEDAKCLEVGDWPDGDRFENHVAAFLWDLTDAGSIAEPWDKDSGDGQVRAIFSLFDKELERPGPWPTIYDITFPLSADNPPFPTNSGMDIALHNRISWVILS